MEKVLGAFVPWTPVQRQPLHPTGNFHPAKSRNQLCAFPTFKCWHTLLDSCRTFYHRRLWHVPLQRVWNATARLLRRLRTASGGVLQDLKCPLYLYWRQVELDLHVIITYWSLSSTPLNNLTCITTATSATARLFRNSIRNSCFSKVSEIVAYL